jgi:diketogulonate reductase-like aldo/keto reductase
MPLSDLKSRRKLNNGTTIPLLGFGVHNLKEKAEFVTAVDFALKIGYRHFDTASIYGNEELLGRTIKGSGISRSELFITTKLWKSDFGYDAALKAFDNSLQRLDMDYVDLYLIHWPQKEKLTETWEAFEQIYHSGKAKAIGVSNFSIDYLALLIKNCKIKPMVNQVEHHPYLLQKDLVGFCFDNEIQVVAHSPLMWGRIVNDNNFKLLSDKYRKSIAQIVLRWNLQKGIAVIPKSAKLERISENAEIFDYQISDADMKLIDGLDENRRIGGTP